MVKKCNLVNELIMRTHSQITRPYDKISDLFYTYLSSFWLTFWLFALGVYSYSLFKIAQESQKDKEAQEAVKIAVTQ